MNINELSLLLFFFNSAKKKTTVTTPLVRFVKKSKIIHLVQIFVTRYIVEYGLHTSTQ